MQLLIACKMCFNCKHLFYWPFHKLSSVLILLFISGTDFLECEGLMERQMKWLQVWGAWCDPFFSPMWNMGSLQSIHSMIFKIPKILKTLEDHLTVCKFNGVWLLNLNLTKFKDSKMMNALVFALNIWAQMILGNADEVFEASN